MICFSVLIFCINKRNTHTGCTHTTENNNALHKWGNGPITIGTYVSMRRKLIQKSKLYREYNNYIVDS
jgi:hypothetical protein